MNHQTLLFSPPFINLYVLIFFLISETSFAVDFHFQNCSVPSTCGGQNISFPFYIPGQQEAYCGNPGFQISCIDEHPTIPLAGDVYIVHNINYQNQTLVVSNKALSNSNSPSCIPVVTNITFPTGRFDLLPKQKEIFLVYNCTSALGDESFSKYKIGCFGTSSSVLALPGDQQKLFARVSEKCGNKVVVNTTVEDYGSDILKSGIREVLRRGFVMKWIAANCGECESSGGKCGFDLNVHQFRCYCPDRPHRVSCKEKNLKRKLGLGIVVGGPVFLGILGILVACFFLIRCYKKNLASSKGLSRNFSSQPYSKSDLEGGNAYFGVSVFTYEELKEATNHFDSEKEIGDGGFGAVYYGKLKDGREVAVKRLYEHNFKRQEQFMNEIEILTRLRHKNLVSLYGCTSRRSRELILVYEYISNGTVADHLHGDLAESCPLTWPIRMSIAIETANALSYLHLSDIVHRDVKTTNILLDNNFTVKVADFGLSRLFPLDVTHVSTAPQGTPGYVDPEYHQCYQLTSKSDVYSFGVVLVELISSLPAVDITRHRHEINLSNIALNKIQKGLYSELVDSCLGFESDHEVKRMTIAVAELAYQCLQQDNDARPTMSEVLETLQMIERGKDVPQNRNEVFDDIEMRESIQPPPSPECDELQLLKNIKPPFSPNSVTQRWPSTSSSTPNASC
ncbi:LEAF RUST 10 DISEASE-RESISTANCE LOCUS RECEPTOR-LIKE PROTEIN KINASE-like 1.2 isoform X3 [Argentina anserina]|uniref:LEAF RUST 10 DISEASE-RESISTANCE LOCUS RECEPTOR-LIKE PROTEIN KINASE-like 1.2 isoform X3 n=1 Tax=Argentina anserina TaxID=57926 RepID=UPI0021765416|nr:LEAF RUST 10 DISEASE-RESISTANCE LOCUS RECEPTOR-LIKE PROTEIN KINASE-like 1.2 isoform X3 [Potentilla anserina]